MAKKKATYRLKENFIGHKAGDIIEAEFDNGVIYIDNLYFKNDTTFRFIFEEVIPEDDGTTFKPRYGDEYYTIGMRGTSLVKWEGDYPDETAYKSGNVFKTEKSAEKELERRMAVATLKRSGDHITDEEAWKKMSRGWTVYFSDEAGRLDIENVVMKMTGAVAYYRTREQAIESVNKYDEEWKIVLGVK